MTLMNTDDKQLISRLRADDEQAMAELLKRHWTNLVRYAYGLLGDWDRARDVTQGACERLWANRDRWPKSSSAVLLYRITRDGALDALKSRRYAVGSDTLDVLAARSAPQGDTERAEFEEAVAEAVETLPPGRREVFQLARERGFSYSEIAEVTRLSRRSVANQMSLAVSDLRMMLRPLLPVSRGGEGPADSHSVDSESVDSYPADRHSAASLPVSPGHLKTQAAG